MVRLISCAAVVLGFFSCLPPLSAVEGKPCDDAHVCPDALFCVEGLCARELPTTTNDAGTPVVRQLLRDDCETLGNWMLVGGTRLAQATAPVHAGANSCRVSTGDTPGTAVAIESAALPVQTGTYCVRAWLAQGLIPSRAVITLRRYGGPLGTTLLEESPMTPANTSLADAGASFRELAASIDADLNDTTGVKVSLTMEALPGVSAYFDELVVMHATPGGDAGCP